MIKSEIEKRITEQAETIQALQDEVKALNTAVKIIVSTIKHVTYQNAHDQLKRQGII